MNTTRPQIVETPEDAWERAWFERAVANYRPGPLRTYRELKELGDDLRAARRELP